MRLVFGEADGLPGLIVDRYADQLVTQFQSAGVDAWREPLIAALMRGERLRRRLRPQRRRDPRARGAAGPSSGVLRGRRAAVADRSASSTACAFSSTCGAATRPATTSTSATTAGWHARLVERQAQLAAARLRCLNCFCYTGGFSIAMLAGGAEHVHSIDSSADALRLAAEHARTQRHRRPSACRWEEADVFTALRALQDDGAQFDLIVLDPPKFASSHHHVDRAARAYKDINLNALRLLAPGGSLLTFSCSGAIDVDLFQKIVAGAVIDAGVDAWMVARLGAGDDHPLMMTVPESEYLKGLHLVRTG